MTIPLQVLIVEDVPTDAELVVMRLAKENFKLEWQRVENEDSYRAALAARPNLILSDWSLPNFSGMRALQVMREHNLDTPFIIVSGSIGEDAAVAALRAGAYDYVLKDRSDRLGQAVRNALEQKRLRDEQKQAEKLLHLQAAALNAAANAIVITDRDGIIQWANPAFSNLTGYTLNEAAGKNPRQLVKSDRHEPDFYKSLWDTILAGEVWQGELVNRRKDGTLYNEEQTITPVLNPDGEISQFIAIKQDITQRKLAALALQQSSQELSNAYDATLQGWSHALELREQETAGHSNRVVKLTLELAAELGLPPHEIIHIQRGALLHDIGKMGIPDSILLKPGPLTEDEWVVMRQHPLYAYQLLSRIPYLLPALDIPYCHHERWDGAGYPRGLQGHAIPLAARIFAIVDVWDALGSNRPYRPAWPQTTIRKYIQDQSGKQFDPRVVDAFLEIAKKFQTADIKPSLDLQ